MTDFESTQPGDSLDDEALASALESEGSEVAPEAAPVEEAAAETPEGSDQESDQEAAFEYLEDFAKKADIDPDVLLGLKVKLKVDGEEKDATLRDVIKINQLEGHVNRKSQELSEARKAFEETTRQTAQQWQERVGVASTFLDQQEQTIRQQFQSIDWNSLYQQDPAQYAALQARFNEAAMTLQGQKAQLAQHYNQVQQQQRETIRPKAAEAIRQANPDLADDASYSNALADMRGYLKSIGANEKSAEALELDPVVFQAVRDAARYRAIAAKKPDVANKVRQATTVQKPSTGSQVGTKQAHIAKLREAARNGSEDALAELFEIL